MTVSNKKLIQRVSAALILTMGVSAMKVILCPNQRNEQLLFTLLGQENQEVVENILGIHV